MAVVLSEVEYQKIKLEHLLAALAVGEKELDRGEFADYSLEKLQAKLDSILEHEA